MGEWVLGLENVIFFLTALTYGGGGAVPLTLLWFFALYSKYLEATHTFFSECPYEKNIQKFSFTPSQSTLIYGHKTAHGRKG